MINLKEKEYFIIIIFDKDGNFRMIELDGDKIKEGTLYIKDIGVMEFFDKFVENGLIEKLQKLVDSKFTRISHEDVITILKEAKVDFEFKPEYGEDIAKEHEKYLTEEYDQCYKTLMKKTEEIEIKINIDNIRTEKSFLFSTHLSSINPIMSLRTCSVEIDVSVAIAISFSSSAERSCLMLHKKISRLFLK